MPESGSGDLELAAGGRRLRFPAVWLRDNCPCAECLDPRSKQKFLAITDLSTELAVASAAEVGESVVVTYAPDRHRSVFSRAWLAGHALDGYDDGAGRTEDDKALWQAPDLFELPAASWPQASWQEYLAEPAERIRGLAAVMDLGFVLLHDVPVEPGTVLQVAATFGYVRETNYGALFDVRVEPAPGNLAYTSREILPHTDNPYRDPVPTIQLLHCLRAAGDGGDTGLVDGFAAARDLRAADRGSFDVLTRTSASFGYSDNGTELRASQPLIQLSPRGRIREVRFNNRSAQPLRLPYDDVTAFYAAYRRWAELLAQPERQLDLRLAPGDCLIFDNTRILHARTAFSLAAGAAGSQGRHLQGCYADLDGLASTLAVISRPGDNGRGPGPSREES
ncbi:MAG TPA: TauD/TfdA family dioxygenase [Streptosporangiaceae bacterium]